MHSEVDGLTVVSRGSHFLGLDEVRPAANPSTVASKAPILSLVDETLIFLNVVKVELCSKCFFSHPP